MRPSGWFRFFAAMSIGLTIAVALLLRWRLAAPWLGAYLIAINCTTFVAYLYDKTAAGREIGRIPENLLHLLAALGGSPAALIGQSLLRHKTAKRSFRKWFYAILLMQLVLIAGWLYYARPWV